MKQFRNRAIGIAMLLTLAAVGVLMTAHQGSAQNGNPNPGSAPVNIVSPLPLPVRNVNEPTLQPFRGRIELVFVSGNLGSNRLFMTVPAGKRLVIEHISHSAFNAAGEFNFGGFRVGEF